MPLPAPTQTQTAPAAARDTVAPSRPSCVAALSHRRWHPALCAPLSHCHFSLPSRTPTHPQNTHLLCSDKEGLVRTSSRLLSQANVPTNTHLTGHFYTFSPLFSFSCSSLIHIDPSLPLPLVPFLNIPLQILCNPKILFHLHNTRSPTSLYATTLHSHLERISLVVLSYPKLMGHWAKIR